ncbi:DUF2931 family protein [Pseudomonas sp. AB6]|uniref:DUF2931 family protein n=2 Tax=unclassified Pseudomonas TaxID=196821 RepID=UPI003A0FF9E9
MKKLWILLGLAMIAGCQAADPLSGVNDPHHPWWDLRFSAPYYMTGWVEMSAVVDINNRFFPRRGGGGIGIEVFQNDDIDDARGWSDTGGNGSFVTGADLPKRVFVRWQSSVEPQTYQGWIEIPEEARQLMRYSIARRCAEDPEEPASWHPSLTLGLAPGGIVQVWVWDECLRRVAFNRVQVEVEPLGPYLGKSNGHYFQQTKDSKQYIERFGIPYGSW